MRVPRARHAQRDPDDQAHIARPRVGYAGVIDERLDLDLLSALAASRPDVQIVMVGPVVKIDPAWLPAAPNIHYLGPKPYDELRRYMAGWDVAMMPFALNESTRYISPPKTPEYLAAGCPVASAPSAMSSSRAGSANSCASPMAPMPSSPRSMTR